MKRRRTTIQAKKKESSDDDDEDDGPGLDTLRVPDGDLFRDGFHPSKAPRRSSFGSHGSCPSTAEPSSDLKGFIHGQLSCFSMENDKILFLKVCQADGMVSCGDLCFSRGFQSFGHETSIVFALPNNKPADAKVDPESFLGAVEGGWKPSAEVCGAESKELLQLMSFTGRQTAARVTSYIAAHMDSGWLLSRDKQL